MSPDIEYTVPAAMTFLRNQVNDLEDDELFRATTQEQRKEFQYGTTMLDIARVGYTAENTANSLPNIKYQIRLKGITSHKYTPWVAYPSVVDVGQNKAALLACIAYFAAHPTSLTVTRSAQNPKAS